LPKGNLRHEKKLGRTRRPRRSAEEIIDRLVGAASEEFERNGYAGTKTAAIAEKAGVAEWLIFTHFGSKARLFRDSIFKPLNQHFLDFCSTHMVDPGDSEGLRKETREYISELHQFVERHSKTLISLLFAQLYEGENVEGLSQIDGLHDYFSRGAAMATDRLTGKPMIDPKLIVRVSFATIIACVMFKDLLFPKGLATKDEIKAAVRDFVMYGLNANANPNLDVGRGSRRNT
jgi:AcrR family transcriptional regulator